jgi:FkbM family methyltransferase|uniref:Methyltransferase FkbM domain-containing protein n=1 Tax=viral metagenome TaxID=1070528 RepID=A0A6C0CID3_9ZZZZ
MNLIKLGTNYGGWFIPKDIKLDENSIIYSGGVGEDMSFDLILNDKYKCNILLIDPTNRAITHFEEVKNYFKNNEMFTGNIQNDYYDNIKSLKPDMTKFCYENIGLWDKKDQLKFFFQNNPNNVSQSVITNMFGNNYSVVEVDTIKNIMNKYNHNKIDLLKLDIEGAEVQVLENMLCDKIYPKYLCIEFDLKLKNKDVNNKTETIIQKLLKEGYNILINDDLNITFELK